MKIIIQSCSNLIINNPSINFRVSEMPRSFLVSFPSTKNRKTALRHLYHESLSTTHTPPSPEKFPPKHTWAYKKWWESQKYFTSPCSPFFEHWGEMSTTHNFSEPSYLPAGWKAGHRSEHSEWGSPPFEIHPAQHSCNSEGRMRQQPQKCEGPIRTVKKKMYVSSKKIGLWI